MKTFPAVLLVLALFAGAALGAPVTNRPLARVDVVVEPLATNEFIVTDPGAYGGLGRLGWPALSNAMWSIAAAGVSAGSTNFDGVTITNNALVGGLLRVSGNANILGALLLDGDVRVTNGNIIAMDGAFHGNGYGLSNAAPTLATNAATASDGMVLSKTGGQLKLVTPTIDTNVTIAFANLHADKLSFTYANLAGATNASPGIATNNATAPEGSVLVKTGDNLGLRAAGLISGSTNFDGVVITNNATIGGIARAASFESSDEGPGSVALRNSAGVLEVMLDGTNSTVRATNIWAQPNVKWWGAKGDWNGTTGTDDTAAFSNAIQFAKSDFHRFYVEIPPGNYKISADLNLTELNGGAQGTDFANRMFTVKGSGQNSVLHYTGTNVCLDLTGSTRVTLKDFFISRLTDVSRAAILASRSSTNTDSGKHRFENMGFDRNAASAHIVFLNQEICQIVNCVFENHLYPCIIADPWNFGGYVSKYSVVSTNVISAIDCRVERCTFYSELNTNGIIRILDTGEWVVSQCSFYTLANTNSAAVTLSSPITTQAADLRFVNNTMEGYGSMVQVVANVTYQRELVVEGNHTPGWEGNKNWFVKWMKDDLSTPVFTSGSIRNNSGGASLRLPICYLSTIHANGVVYSNVLYSLTAASACDLEFPYGSYAVGANPRPYLIGSTLRATGRADGTGDNEVIISGRSRTGGLVPELNYNSNGLSLWGYRKNDGSGNEEGVNLQSTNGSVILTALSGGDGADNMPIMLMPLGTGGVGIGTTPVTGSTLHVKGVASIEAGGIDGALADSMFFKPTGYPLAQDSRIRVGNSSAATGNMLVFETSTGTTGVYNTNQLTLSGNGFVGIGTLFPTAPLSVSNSAATLAQFSSAGVPDAVTVSSNGTVAALHFTLNSTNIETQISAQIAAEAGAGGGITIADVEGQTNINFAGNVNVTSNLSAATIAIGESTNMVCIVSNAVPGPGITYWFKTTNGALTFPAVLSINNTNGFVGIGASGSARLTVGSNLRVGGPAYIEGSIESASASKIYWSVRSSLYSPADGYVSLTDLSAKNFIGLIFGTNAIAGVNAPFMPMLKKQNGPGEKAALLITSATNNAGADFAVWGELSVSNSITLGTNNLITGPVDITNGLSAFWNSNGVATYLRAGPVGYTTNKDSLLLVH